jgi:hypothetical protein
MIDYKTNDADILDETPFIYFVAKPKRGNKDVVHWKVADIVELYAKLYDHRANCNLHSEMTHSGQWTIFMTFENESDRAILDQNTQFQDMLIDLRTYCKPAYRMRRLLHPVFHPGKRFAGIIKAPAVFPDRENRS